MGASANLVDRASVTTPRVCALRTQGVTLLRPDTRPTDDEGALTNTDDRDRTATSPVAAPVRFLVIAVAVVRAVTPVAALPLIPVLLEDRLLLLVLLRPNKDLLLLSGGVLRLQGEPAVWLLFLAYVPLMVLAVWAFFVLGRAYEHALRGEGGPAWLRRLTRPERVARARRVLSRRGPAIAVLARLAAFPPTVLATAAGASRVRPGRYLVADAVGALLAFAGTVGVGWMLGEAYRAGGPLLTGAGLVVVITLIVLLTRWVRSEAGFEEPPQNGA